MPPEIIDIFRESMAHAEHLIISVILLTTLAGILIRFHEKLLSLPFLLIKLVAYQIAEWIGKLKGCPAREIKRNKKKISNTIDMIEGAKGISDTCKFKK